MRGRGSDSARAGVWRQLWVQSDSSWTWHLPSCGASWRSSRWRLRHHSRPDRQHQTL